MSADKIHDRAGSSKAAHRDGAGVLSGDEDAVFFSLTLQVSVFQVDVYQTHGLPCRAHRAMK